VYKRVREFKTKQKGYVLEKCLGLLSKLVYWTTPTQSELSSPYSMRWYLLRLAGGEREAGTFAQANAINASATSSCRDSDLLGRRMFGPTRSEGLGLHLIAFSAAPSKTIYK